jgi:hypothetical protein
MLKFSENSVKEVLMPTLENTGYKDYTLNI